MWDLETYECIKTLTGHNGGIECFEILADQHIISGSLDKKIKVWNLRDGLCLKTFSFHESAVRILKILSDNKIASASFHEVVIFDLETNENKIIISNKMWVHDILFLPSKYLATCSKDYSHCSNDGIQIWNIDTGLCIKKVNDFKRINFNESDETFNHLCLLNSNVWVTASTIWPNIQSIIKNEGNLTYTENIKIWNPESIKTIIVKETVDQININQPTNGNGILLLCPIDNNQLITYTRDKMLQIWDAQSGNCKKAFMSGEKRLLTLKYYQDNLLFTGSSDNLIRMIDLETSECLRTLNGHNNSVTDIKIVNLS